ncbi:MAG: hypothetical protein ACKOXO_08310 [Cyanobium sp.]
MISAFPDDLNPGMLSVDLAAIQFLASAGFDFACFNTEHSFYDTSCGDQEARHEYLQDPSQLDSFDRILFWGDFVHWLPYALQDWGHRYNKIHRQELDRRELLNRWYYHVFLDDNAALQSKAILFGSTFYGLDGRQLTLKSYQSHLSNLLNRCLQIQPRDLYSAVFANQLCGTEKAQLGCDAAFFLDDSKLIASVQESDLDSRQRSLINDSKPLILCVPVQRARRLQANSDISDLLTAA